MSVAMETKRNCPCHNVNVSQELFSRGDKATHTHRPENKCVNSCTNEKHSPTSNSLKPSLSGSTVIKEGRRSRLVTEVLLVFKQKHNDWPPE